MYAIRSYYAEEVTIKRVFADKAGVAAVVIEQGIVQPGWVLDRLHPGWQTGCVRERIEIDFGEGVPRLSVISVIRIA